MPHEIGPPGWDSETPRRQAGVPRRKSYCLGAEHPEVAVQEEARVLQRSSAQAEHRLTAVVVFPTPTISAEAARIRRLRITDRRNL